MQKSTGFVWLPHYAARILGYFVCLAHHGGFPPVTPYNLRKLREATLQPRKLVSIKTSSYFGKPAEEGVRLLRDLGHITWPTGHGPYAYRPLFAFTEPLGSRLREAL